MSETKHGSKAVEQFATMIKKSRSILTRHERRVIALGRVLEDQEYAVKNAKTAADAAVIRLQQAEKARDQARIEFEKVSEVNQ